MFYERFIALCKERGEKPTALMEDLGFSRGTSSKWKKQYDNGKDTLPEVLILIALAKHFDVTVEYLATGEIPDDSSFSFEEKQIIFSYRKANGRDKKLVQDILEQYREDTAFVAV